MSNQPPPDRHHLIPDIRTKEGKDEFDAVMTKCAERLKKGRDTNGARLNAQDCAVLLAAFASMRQTQLRWQGIAQAERNRTGKAQLAISLADAICLHQDAEAAYQEQNRRHNQRFFAINPDTAGLPTTEQLDEMNNKRMKAAQRLFELRDLWRAITVEAETTDEETADG